jgi:O-methyltransferase
MESATDTKIDMTDRYLDLMKQCLTRNLILEEEVREVTGHGLLGRLYSPVRREMQRRGLIFGKVGGDPESRRTGRDWPRGAETMVGLARLDNVHQCVLDVIRNDVPGDLIETGVWRGGTTIFMRALLAALGDEDRKVWVADSFAGLPRPDVGLYPPDVEFEQEWPVLAVSAAEVRANFAKYGLLDSRVGFLEGWFKDTLPVAPITSLSVMRLDGDLYESTMDALVALYPKLSVGGYVIVDDYGALKPCREAVDDYRAKNGVTETINEVDWTGVFWQRDH